jgi:cell volume regulation protein A
LLSVIISSTDAAAIFSILRRQTLPRKLASTIEIESAANDPMAILSTLVVVEAFATGVSQGWLTVPLFLWKFAAGPLLGWLIALGAIEAFDRLNPQERGYYYVLLLGVVLLTYGLTELAGASGMLAAFTAGLVMGNRKFVYRQGVANFAAALAMIANIGVFVLMGVLVFPSQWADIWMDGVLLFAVLTFVARPLAVWLGTVGMRIPRRDRHFMSWAGLRGAVPIVLATYPMAAGLEVGERVFNLVFFAVLLSVAIQGSSLGAVARQLGLSEPKRPMPRYGLDLVTMARSKLGLTVVDLPGPKGRPGARVRDLVLPSEALVTLIARGDEVVPPTGNTRLRGWDQVTVLARPEDEERVRKALLARFENEAPADVAEPEMALTAPPSDEQAAIEALRGHAVLLGHGRVGAILAGMLRRADKPFVVIEQDALIVERLRRQGALALAGSAESSATLDRAGIAHARMLLVTTSSVIATETAIEYARAVNPEIDVIARVHFAEQRSRIERLPRTRAVHGEEELAYAMARLALGDFGLNGDDAEAWVDEARAAVRGAAPAPNPTPNPTG